MYAFISQHTHTNIKTEEYTQIDQKNMDAKTTNINNFEPLSDFVHEGDCDTLLLYLPGFTKEQLRVQLARSGVLKIGGTRPTGDNKSSSFQKDFPVSANCDTSKITAKFEEGILYVRQPKLIVPAVPDKKLTPETPQELHAKTTETPQELHAKTTETSHDKTTSNKPVPNEEVDKSSEGTTKLDDIPEKTAGNAHGDKRENVSGGELASKGADDIAKLLGGWKLDGESPAAKLKVARQKMTTVLVVLFAFALGMCISKLQAWFSGEANH